MKKILFLSILSGIISLSGYSQSPIGQGGKQFNIGVGLYDAGLPIYAGMDFGVHPDITVGPQVGFDLTGDYLNISGRGDYHFNTVLSIPQDWDFYAGLNVGFKLDFDDDDLSGADLGLQIGGRYYWSDWGVNLEFGGGNLLYGGRFGLSKRF